mgnify:CR=1 FL=1
MVIYVDLALEIAIDDLANRRGTILQTIKPSQSIRSEFIGSGRSTQYGLVPGRQSRLG